MVDGLTETASNAEVSFKPRSEIKAAISLGFLNKISVPTPLETTIDT
jgi:hypothetical protein